MSSVFIVGPTASGKSAVSMLLAGSIGGEIINADSMQIYRELNIGSAKPTPDEMKRVPHHLYGIVGVGEPFSVSDYESRASAAIADISDRGRIPIICGGSGLYINSLLYDMDFGHTAADANIRTELHRQLDALGVESLYNRLLTVDAESASRIHSNDAKRIIRALEVFLSTGVKLSERKHDFGSMKRRNIGPVIGLRMERKELNERIDKRVDVMLKDGLVEECRQILDLGVSIDHPSMQGIGYKQVFMYLNGEYDYETMRERIMTVSHQFAKRQMTWFNRYRDYKWIDLDNDTTANDIIAKILDIIKSN